MDYLKYIALGLLILFVGYIFLRVYTFGIAKSIIEAIQQSLQTKKIGKENKKNGKIEKRNDEREVERTDRTE